MMAPAADDHAADPRGQRWLWITAELPGEMDTGRLVYSGNLMAAVADLGVDLTVVGFGNAGRIESSDITWHPVPGELRGGWRSLFSPLPNLAYACAHDALRTAVSSHLRDPWDVIVVDHLQVGWAAELVADLDATTVFVTHNHEASVRHDVARELPVWSPRRAVLTWDAWKAGRLERSTLERVDAATAITDSDRILLNNEFPDLPVLVLPPGWSGTVLETPRPFVERSRAIGVLGSFDWHVKQENLRRFVNAADRALDAANIELRVAGSVPDDFRREIEAFSTSVTFLGFVEHPADFLADVRLGLIAEPLGGGFKLKSLDYVYQGVPIAATTGSAEGLPLRRGHSIVEADDPERLVEAIVEVIDDIDELGRIAHEAVTLCGEMFTWSRQAVLFSQFVVTVR